MKEGDRGRLIGAKMEGNGALMPALRRRDRRGSFPVRRRNQREEEDELSLAGGTRESVGGQKKKGTGALAVLRGEMGCVVGLERSRAPAERDGLAQLATRLGWLLFFSTETLTGGSLPVTPSLMSSLLLHHVNHAPATSNSGQRFFFINSCHNGPDSLPRMSLYNPLPVLLHSPLFSLQDAPPGQRNCSPESTISAAVFCTFRSPPTTF